ncbi:putative GPI anchored protein [Microthyrium microscopicum]|uniref:Putative GPI anchored protein n=1 Tax=Microthyrium microscopicum TaxID=703497 RepID=A0A6A6UHQ9_9PEZI|nr:putative GPI anchored protein [Microthyrium microscopicum]
MGICKLLSASLYIASAFASTSYIIKYSTVPGYFLQDLNTTNATTFDYTTVNFGLINRTYTDGQTVDKYGTPLTQWQKFEAEVIRLQLAAGAGSKHTDYKVVFFGRHGEGYHNAAETFYGTPAWNCYWAELNGNSTTSWDDAKLTANGVKQAQVANAFWASRIALQKIRTPDTYFTSPLSRCLATANITFSGLSLPKKSKFVPLIKEYLREGISIHTCDRRSNKTYIAKTYPGWKIEPNFSEYDQIWNGVTSETNDAEDLRSKVALDDIFSSKSGLFVSVTSHSGEIGSLLRVLGHQAFSLNTGAIIPVLVKAEKLPGTPTTGSATWTQSPHCTAPPLSSISNGACVCPSSAAPVTSLLVTESPSVTPTVTFRPTGV